MLEHIFHGTKGYWSWVLLLLLGIGAGLTAYLYQLQEGMWVTGMSRDVSWGFYISQFTFLVGVAASVFVVVMPLYLYSFEEFSDIALPAQFLSVAALLMSLLFIFCDVGMPMRIFNVPLHPTPHSMLFYDTILIPGFILLNLVIGWTALDALKRGVPMPGWVRGLIYLSMPWAVLMHTVTAFIYAGTPGRGFWMTAIMVPRFLVSAFATGCALLIILCTVLQLFCRFTVQEKAVQNLAAIMLYCLVLDAFFLGVEYFTAWYSHIPMFTETLQYLFIGIDGNTAFVPWYRTMNIAILTAVALLCIPAVRNRRWCLVPTCLIALAGLWIDKGFILVSAAFIPNVFGKITEYPPTAVELTVSLGVYCLGILVLTFLYKVFTVVVSQAGVGSKTAGRTRPLSPG